MHLYIAARGHTDRLNRWENDCLAQYYDYQYGSGANGIPLRGKIQLAMRPIRFYEVAFPAAVKEKVLADIQPYGGYGFQDGLRKKSIDVFRKLLGLQKIPEIPPDPRRFLYKKNVDVLGLGIKEDNFKYIPVEDL